MTRWEAARRLARQHGVAWREKQREIADMRMRILKEDPETGALAPTDGTTVGWSITGHPHREQVTHYRVRFCVREDGMPYSLTEKQVTHQTCSPHVHNWTVLHDSRTDLEPEPLPAEYMSREGGIYAYDPEAGF